MGTRCITHVYQMPHLGGEIVASFYRQFDGYYEGHGKDITDWLKDKKLTNGWSSNKNYESGLWFNRSGQMVIELMHQVGNLELEKTDESRTEEFTYYVTYNEDVEKFKVRGVGYGEELSGFADEWETLLENLDQEE